MPYKFVEGLTRADVAFEVKGRNINRFFEDSAMALFDIMANPKKVSKKIKKTFKIEKNNIEDLMYGFLEEIIFLKDKDAMVFNSCKISINETKKLKLKATLFGDRIDHEKQELRVDPKAVTMHKFLVKKEKGNYIARVIIDI